MVIWQRSASLEVAKNVKHSQDSFKVHNGFRHGFLTNSPLWTWNICCFSLWMHFLWISCTEHTQVIYLATFRTACCQKQEKDILFRRFQPYFANFWSYDQKNMIWGRIKSVMQRNASNYISHTPFHPYYLSNFEVSVHFNNVHFHKFDRQICPFCCSDNMWCTLFCTGNFSIAMRFAKPS